jgi:predicted TIM-barrel fold metal-dependent hydrolase
VPTIDADCHVIESDHTWDYLDPSDAQYRPQPYVSPSDPDGLYWMIDDEPRRRSFGNRSTGSSQETQSGFDRTTLETRTLADVKSRLAHMDELGVDVQVLYPTIYLTQISPRPEVDLALAKSYNRWLADIWASGEGRLRWAAVPPLLTMDEVPEQLRFAKDNGACGVFMRGFEGDRIISDSYFDPLYEAASELDLPITVHAGCGNPPFADFSGSSAFIRNKVPVTSAFHELMFKGVPAKFPKLRFGFVEVAADWVPYMITDLARRLERAGKSIGEDPLGDNRMYVACQTNDDIPHIVSCVGDDNLMIGSDYGHSDTSTELEALRELKKSSDVPAATIDKILWDNPKRLYGVSS